MSRHHSRTQTASLLWNSRRRLPKAGATRDVEIDMDLEAKRWAAIAPKLGFCGGCGANVDEANGKLHDEQCMPAEPSRCAKGQIT